MQEKLETEREWREQQLNYAFNSLIKVPQVFKFRSINTALNWVRKYSPTLIGLLIEKKFTFILFKIKRKAESCGLEVEQQCTIWIKIPTTQRKSNIAFLNYKNNPTFS